MVLQYKHTEEGGSVTLFFDCDLKTDRFAFVVKDCRKGWPRRETEWKDLANAHNHFRRLAAGLSMRPGATV
jgi:hypothetical protein